MVTDAKALYDSYHREGVSSSVVDKRVGLEIRVMKEMLEELNGQLRWMSSERQIADGLTMQGISSCLVSCSPTASPSEVDLGPELCGLEEEDEE